MSEIRVGIDLGGTKVEGIALQRRELGGQERHGSREGDGEYVTLARVRRATERDRGYEHILDVTAEVLAETERQAGVKNVARVGIGMPGSLTEAGMVKNANTTALNGRPFRSDLVARLGRPIVFANDANCFALAERVLGAARGARVTFGVIMGTGVGGGIVIADEGAPRVWDGAQGIAGEWGHVALEPERGPACYCGRRGCIETYLSGPFIEKDYLARAGVARRLVDVAAARATDPAARATLEHLTEMFGRALATVVNVLDPDVIVLGGGVSNVDVLYDAGIEALRRWAFTDVLRTRVVKNAVGDSAGVFGAAFLPK
ncbi:ROK family protein [Pendulispora albinea]|uniref:ROK family protein n=1 Tax=Pendulispora albinea TaxID=2741071 RepID=A0ABZ2M829_9BACT